MSSHSPPTDQTKRGIRQTLLDRLRRTKLAILRDSDPPIPSRRIDFLSTSHIGSQTPSRSQPGTPSLNPALAPSVIDEYAILPDPSTAPSTETTGPSSTAIIGSKGASHDMWASLTESLRQLESSTEMFPPLKSALGAIANSLGIVQSVTSNRKDHAALTEEFQRLANTLKLYANRIGQESSNGSIANFAQCIESHAADIKQRGERGAIRRVIDVNRDEEDIIAGYRQIESSFRRLLCDITMRTHDHTKRQFQATLLRGISPVDDARYNSSYSTIIKRRGCTVQTREAVLILLKNWTTNPKGEKIYWMNGMAGTGKTTIAYSFCEWLEKNNRLGGSFFCSRISSTCRSLSKIVPTIAYQLARYSLAFRSKLCAALEDNPDAGTLNVMQQFEELMKQPLLSGKNAMPDTVVIVIDALDECDDGFSVRLLLDVLLKFAEDLPLKFFVSSRPEHVIRERMISPEGSARSILYLHDIEESVVEGDIKKYLTEKLSKMDPPPSSEQIQCLARRSRNLFIYAATVVRYIHPEDFPVDSSARLESVLEAMGNTKVVSKNKYEDLDRLYTTVLSAAFNDYLDDDEKYRIQCILRTIVCAREPLSAATLASLVSLTERQVWVALTPLRSVVHVSENKGLISALHASFPEYMLNQTRSKEFHSSESKSNEALARRCFDIMKLGLKFNICALENSYLTDDQVNELGARVTRFISSSLSYACRHWSSHLLLAPAEDHTRDMMIDFLITKLLFWMEVLSLSRCIGIGVPMLQQAQNWLQQIKSNRNEIQKQLSDARNFLTWFAANPCSRSTPHIYISALPFCAKSSWVYQHYFRHTQGLVRLSINRYKQATLAVWSVEIPGNSISISPEGGRIAYGSDDGNVQVYDTYTGAIVAGPFRGHTKRVLCVQFSPSGVHIASCSADASIIIRDAYTNQIISGPLRGHTKAVWSVAFSPDGKRLVSGSIDETIIVWDTYTGAIALGPLKGHSDMILSVAFSPDCQLIASGSSDWTIRLWDASSGVTVAEPFKGHQGGVSMIAFSSDGSKIASSSFDGTIRLWCTNTSTPIGLPLEGHRGPVWSFAFSSDSAYIVSCEGRKDHTITVWEVLTGSVVLGPLSGHRDRVVSVVFSPDDVHIVTCSVDRTIRIWDSRAKKRALGQQNTHELSVGPAAFLPDCTQFIANSSKGLLRVWDAYTGAITPSRFKGQAELGAIQCLAVSFRGSYVVASTNDFTVRVWNVLTGAMASQPLEGHQDLVRCLAFSPNETHICSGSDDGTIIVWDIEPSSSGFRSCYGHTGPVRSIVYSPDGTRIVSGAIDCTVRVWDPTTGTLVFTLTGHEHSVESVAFSPDGRYIVSGSASGRILQWDFTALGKPDIIQEGGVDAGVTCVRFSPDGTYIVAAAGSIIRITCAQTTAILHTFSVTEPEKIHSLAFPPGTGDILSISIPSKTMGGESLVGRLPEDFAIIRGWRIDTQTDQEDSSLNASDWSFKLDGRILSKSTKGLVMWVPPDLFPYLKGWSKPNINTFILSADDIIDMGYKKLCIGKSWADCYVKD